jgi:hypothetical protein
MRRALALLATLLALVGPADAQGLRHVFRPAPSLFPGGRVGPGGVCVGRVAIGSCSTLRRTHGSASRRPNGGELC